MASPLPSDYDQVLCPMPVLRLATNEDGDPLPPTYERCGEHLRVRHEKSGCIWIDGDDDSNSDDTGWKVECQLGHVLLLSDDEANERMSDIPFDPDAALRIIRTVHESWDVEVSD